MNDYNDKKESWIKRKVVPYFVQVGVLTWKNLLLSLRNLKSTLGQLLSPIAIVVVLIILQLVTNMITRKTDEHPKITPIGNTLSNCTVGKNGKCHPLIYAPKDIPWVDKLVRRIANDSGLDFNSFIGFGDGYPKGIEDFFRVNDTITDYILKNQNVTQNAIIFTSPYINESYHGEDLPNELGYWLFYNETAPIDATSRVLVTLEKHITSLRANDTLSNITVDYRPFPKTLYRFSILDISSLLGGNLFYIPPMIIFFVVLVDIVVEKEKRLRLGMRMMGLSNSAYWMSCLIQGLIFVVLSTLILYISGQAARFTFFTRSNFFSVFLLFVIFGVSMISVAMFLSTLIKKSSSAQTVGYAIILAGFVFQSILTSSWGFLIDLLWMETVPQWVVAIRVILHFYPPFNLAKAFSDIAALSSVTFSPNEGKLIEGPGFKWSDMYIGRCFTFGKHSFCIPAPNQSYLILLGNTALFLILTWYFDNVLSGDHGSPRPFYFLFTPEYWGLRKPKPKKPIIREEESDGDYDSDVLEEKNAALNESIHLNRDNHLINIRNLTKIYRKYLCCSSKKDQRAVDNISFNIDDGEIFCLLGHNGAGKTTTINILTGLFKPTSGTATICGYDIVENIDKVQSKMGVCPQHDVLWEDLTAREHLKLFSYVKNIPRDLIEKEVEEKLEMVGLSKVADNVTKSYSGGMKRRLSIAIANIGNPKIIFLDEPTSGLDPMNKSSIWHMIQKIKENKAIVLTTHSMEEAEVLSNRIGIMAYGKIRAIGDPLHLKAKYGEGYRINVVININLSEKFTEKVKSKWEEVDVVENSGAISINVPKSCKDLVPQIVKFLEEDEDVKEWGVSDSTLEGVFLTVTKKHNFVYEDIEEVESPDSDDEAIELENEDQPLIPYKKEIKSYPFRALIRKNLSLQKRQYFDNICQICIPVFVILILLLLKIIIKSQIDSDDQVNLVPGIPFALNFHSAYHNDTWDNPNDPNDFHGNVSPYEIMNRFKDIIYKLPEVYNTIKINERDVIKFTSNIKEKVFDLNETLKFEPQEPEPEPEPQEPEPEPEPQEPEPDLPSNNNCYTYILFTDTESPEKVGYIDKDGNKAGMLREILQYPCRIYEQEDDEEIWVPFFEFRNSTFEIENEIVKYIKIYNNYTNRDIETPPLSYLLPDGHINVHYLNSSDLKIHYSISANEHLTRAYHRRNDFTRTRGGKLYPHYGYFQLVEMVNRAFSVFSLLKKGIDITPLSHLLNVIFVQTMPEIKPFDIWIMIELFGTILYPLGLTIQLPLYLYLLTLEKYEKLKQMMLSHGLKSWHYHLTNYIFFFIFYLLVASAFWIAGFASGSRVFLHTHWSVMLVVLLGWGLSLISLAFFLSSLINSPRVATILGYSVALFGSMLASGVSLFLYGPLPISLETHFPTWLYIWPQFSLSRAIYLMNDNCALKNECYGSLTKLPWSNELPKAILGLYLASIIYFILFLYLDAVLPRQYGVPKHPLFMFQKCKKRKKSYKTLPVEELEKITSQEDEGVHNERLKVENSNYNPFAPLVMSNLRKEYSDGNVAVKGLSLVIEEGECFGLLGENGAGKTTTISMLTGLFKPTLGWATICGYSILTDIDKIHLLMGLCPQFDILWDDLTVKEHILFYARLKGIPPKEEDEHTRRILHEVGLYESRNKLSKKLSGGMKRRLSIAISLVGNSKIVFMDEPTTGLDPASRLQIWKIIQKAKKNRAIILTTHAMDEAELLCTRVGIMAKGIMRCIGESQVLKNKIGDGYRLFLNFTPYHEEESEEFVKSVCNDAVLVERYKSTLVFNLPKDIDIAEVFEKMESNYKDHGIADWALSQISLTDVFRKVIVASKRDEIEENENLDSLIT